MRIKTVQLALADPDYAASIRDLLTQDGMHCVYLVDRPDAAKEGIIFVDSAQIDDLPSLTKEPQRLIVMVHKDRDDLSKIWDAGVRHVVFYGDPPQTARAMVLGLELSLGAIGAA